MFNGDIHEARVFYGTFFVFAFLLPLTAVCILYGCMVHRLMRRSMATAAQKRSTAAAGGKRTPESTRAKRRVTLMVIIVVVVFAICWLPLQVIHINVCSRVDPFRLLYNICRRRLFLQGARNPTARDDICRWIVNTPRLRNSWKKNTSPRRIYATYCQRIINRLSEW